MQGILRDFRDQVIQLLPGGGSPGRLRRVPSAAVYEVWQRGGHHLQMPPGQVVRGCPLPQFPGARVFSAQVPDC